MKAVPDRLAARIAASLLGLRHEFDGWWIHRSYSGRWLAIRGNTCIRAHSPAALRQQISDHLDQTSGQIGGAPNE